MKLKITVEEVPYGITNILQSVKPWGKISRNIKRELSYIGIYTEIVDNAASDPGIYIYYVDTDIYNWDRNAHRTTEVYNIDTEIEDWDHNTLIIPAGSVMGIYNTVDEYIPAAISMAKSNKRNKILKHLLDEDGILLPTIGYLQ